MHLTLDTLVHHAQKLEQQLQEATNYIHRTSGVLHYIREQIVELQKTKTADEKTTEELKEQE